MFELKEAQDFRPTIFKRNGSKSRFRYWLLWRAAGRRSDGCEPVTLAKGDAVVVPASIGNFHVRPQWTVEFLKAACARSARVPEPATRM